jgi:8-oxo-dGTP pyrophosphatase MutT (NUDIX family)
MLRTFWENVISPLISRPSRFQVAALCYRRLGGEVQVLVITSRDTGRWILPKGWPKRGYDAGGTALEEAWEEAGVKSDGAPPRLIGTYRYDKRLKGGVPVTTDVEVFAIRVIKLLDDFPEVGERTREWMTPEDAAGVVDETGLKALLRDLPVTLSD